MRWLCLQGEVSCLMLAAHKGDVKAVKYLMAHGADPLEVAEDVSIAFRVLLSLLLYACEN
jgi:hypothetical protein